MLHFNSIFLLRMSVILCFCKAEVSCQTLCAYIQIFAPVWIRVNLDSVKFFWKVFFLVFPSSVVLVTALGVALTSSDAVHKFSFVLTGSLELKC